MGSLFVYQVLKEPIGLPCDSSNRSKYVVASSFKRVLFILLYQLKRYLEFLDWQYFVSCFVYRVLQEVLELTAEKEKLVHL